MSSGKNLKILPWEKDDWVTWDQWVRRSPQGSIFQTSTYLGAVTSVFQRPAQVIGVWRGEELVGGMVLYPRQKWGMHFATCPFYIPYNGILTHSLSDDLAYLFNIKLQQSVIGLLQNFLRCNFAFTEIYLHPTLQDLRDFIWNKWQFYPTYTVQIPLCPPEEALRRIPHNQRRHIRKFQKLNFEFRESNALDRFFDLWSQSYRHHRMKPPLPASQFIGLCRELIRRGLARCFAMVSDNQEAAMMLVVEDIPYVYGLFSGKHFTPLNNEAELYLHWRIMMYYQERGYEILDLLGAMSPSIARVKLELGGRLQRADHAQYFRTALLRWLYRMMVNVRQQRRSMA